MMDGDFKYIYILFYIIDDKRFFSIGKVWMYKIAGIAVTVDTVGIPIVYLVYIIAIWSSSIYTVIVR